MSILLDDSQTAIATESARALAAKTKMEHQLALLEKSGEYDRDYWDLARAQGWTGMALPEAHGGLGLSLMELGLVMLASGAVPTGAPFLTSSFGAARAILDYGSENLKQAWLGKIASGDAIGCTAFAEAASPLPKHPEVKFSGGKLSGRKPAVPAGAHAHVAIVLASENGRPVLVATDLSGARRDVFNSFDNSRGTANLMFENTPAEVLGTGMVVLSQALQILALQSVVTAFEQTGGAEAMMQRARDYANTRKAFGQPIGAFQSVKHRIAELYGLVELSRANAIHAASREGKHDFIKAAAAARISGTEAYDTASRDCVQIHGGIGVTWEAGLHLHLRRARTLAVEQGNLLFWEDVLVDELVGERA